MKVYVLLLLFAASLLGNEYYVATTGSAMNNGSMGSPWTLEHVLSGAAGVAPADIVWLRGGTYSKNGTWICKASVAGTPSNYITFAQYPTEQVIVIGGLVVDVSNPATMAIQCPYTRWIADDWFGFQLKNTNTTRYFSNWLTCYPVCRAAGLIVQAVGVQIIHLHIRDTGDAFAAQNSSAGLLAYGNTVLYAGWQSTVRGHGHGMYWQNDSLVARKRGEGNVVVSAFGLGAQIYGSSEANVFGIDFVNNVLYENGRISVHGDPPNPSSPDPGMGQLLHGGAADAHDNTFLDNITRAPDCAENSRASGFDPSYGHATDTITLSRNIVHACAAMNNGISITNLTEADNESYGNSRAAAIAQMPNSLFDVYGDAPQRVVQWWSAWKPHLGWVFLESAGASTVNFTPANCPNGTVIELLDLQNASSDPVAEITCDGSPKAVTMAFSGDILDPVGDNPNVPVHPGPEYRLLLLRRTSGEMTSPTISDASPLPEATQVVAYTHQLTGTGGTPPYTYAVTDGALPTGVSLSGSGELTGTPTVAETANFEVTITDAEAASSAKSFQLTVNATASLVLTTSSLNPIYCPVNEQYSAQLEATGGVPPYTWDITVGFPPTGLILSSGGSLAGPCQNAIGRSTFTVRVRDSAGVQNSATRALYLDTVPHESPTITCSAYGIGLKASMICDAEGLPMQQPMHVEVINSESLTVEEFTIGSGLSQRPFLVGSTVTLPVGTYSIIARVGTMSAQTTFTASSISGTAAYLLRLAALPGLAIDNVLVEYGDSISLGSNITESCTTTCTPSIPNRTRGAEIWTRVSYRDASNNVKLQRQAERSIVP